MDRLRVKDELERCERNLQEYEKHDSLIYPAWSLLLPAVVQAYGVCPYLNINNPQHEEDRKEWLRSRGDGGKVHTDAMETLFDPERHASWERMHTLAQEDLTLFVKKALNEHAMDLEEVLKCIRAQQRSSTGRTKSKRDKGPQEVAEKVQNVCGIDISRFIELTEGWKVKLNLETKETDGHFDVLCKKAEDAKNLSMQSVINSNKQRQAAYKTLSKLIDRKFQVEQQGLYFNSRWFNLTPDQQEERIESYCAYYIQGLGQPASLVAVMKDFVLENIASKELRSNDIKWSSKTGLVEALPCEFDDITDTFRLRERVVKKPKKKKPQSEDKNAATDKDELRQKINRLTLLEILTNGDYPRDVIVGGVCNNIRPRAEQRPFVTDLIQSTYEGMSDVVEKNPMTY